MIRCETIIHSLNVGILIIDANLTIHFANKWVGVHANFEPEDALGKNLTHFFDLDENRLKSLHRHIKTALTLGSPSFFTTDSYEYLLAMKNSVTTKSVFEFMQQDITILPYDKEAKKVTLLIYDQTSLMEEKLRSQKESEALAKAVKVANATIKKLETAKNKLIKQKDIIYQQAHCDHLTSLANRSVLNQKLQRLIESNLESGKKFGVLFLDLDNFKEINDSLGHDVGDMILIHVAKTLLLCTRKTDTVTRFGGDEFIILIDSIENEETLKSIASKLVETIAQPIKIRHHDLHVTASIGVSLFPKHGTDFNALIKNADLALYLAKAEGRDTFRIQA
ncbi:diguanylate cyclase domain-containing protein [Sulfurospirillum barnesii]|uniref:Diguanylate cyclase (GGDEF) domain-containing protein n=1 Tax=Sulfurospirillum barnesii (strain ATCC 700032 / DSM 10660 / SES-3) TaxID=760154 RepID=I3XZK2_SULBS|nr:diguanylate cyclase [Sulfurospirillum barnesii]AFL69376.1 diguanylate cyclase (GGDEF) domain-containing protein [Sulfurospirillum barnesii SES-3]